MKINVPSSVYDSVHRYIVPLMRGQTQIILRSRVKIIVATNLEHTMWLNLLPAWQNADKDEQLQILRFSKYKIEVHVSTIQNMTQRRGSILSDFCMLTTIIMIINI